MALLSSERSSGGGPSGLVTLKYLKTAHEFFPDQEPIEVKLFEAKPNLGGTFKYRVYEDAEASSDNSNYPTLRIFKVANWLAAHLL